MGAFLEKPNTEKENEHGSGNGLRYGLSSMQGWRVEMEDAHSAVIGLPQTGLKDWSFFAVFDGHGGVDAAIYAANHLHVNLVHQESFNQDPCEALCRAFKLTDERFVKKASREVTFSHEN